MGIDYLFRLPKQTQKASLLTQAGRHYYSITVMKKGDYSLTRYCQTAFCNHDTSGTKHFTGFHTIYANTPPYSPNFSNSQYPYLAPETCLVKSIDPSWVTAASLVSSRFFSDMAEETQAHVKTFTKLLSKQQESSQIFVFTYKEKKKNTTYNNLKFFHKLSQITSLVRLYADSAQVGSIILVFSRISGQKKYLQQEFHNFFYNTKMMSNYTLAYFKIYFL